MLPNEKQYNVGDAVKIVPHEKTYCHWPYCAGMNRSMREVAGTPQIIKEACDVSKTRYYHITNSTYWFSACMFEQDKRDESEDGISVFTITVKHK